MERPVPMPRGTRPRGRHYYEGFVDKWEPRDQGYRTVWAGLRGLTLAFYNGPQDHEPLEVLDLGKLVAVQAEGGALVLRLMGQDVTMKMESWDTQEMWRGFILTMAKMKIPQDLALLPGHVFQLLEALQEERDRRDTPAAPVTSVTPVTPVAPVTSVTPVISVTPVTPAAPVISVTPVTPVAPVTPVSPATPAPSSAPASSTLSESIPSCFFEVTRAEAERLLEQSAGRGNLLLRPGGHGQGFSLSTRQELGGTALLRHYRVTREAQGYVIGLENPHRCSSLAEVVQFFVKRSKGSLQPLYPEYSSHLEFVQVEEAPPPAAAAPRPAPRRGRGPPGGGAAPQQQIYMNDPGRTQKLLRKPRLRQAHLKD